METPISAARLMELIRDHRLRAMLTQEELARRTGLSSRTIRRLEGGELEHPRISTVRLLAERLGLDEAEAAELVDIARVKNESHGEPPRPGTRAAGYVGPHARQPGVPDDRTAPASGLRVDPPDHGAQIARRVLLPADVAAFSGRQRELAQLDRLLADRREDQSSSTALPVVVISGTGGLGKTALAVHFAHRSRALFPDGQLYVNLQGARGAPLGPAEVLGRFLRALGVDGAALPEGIDERAARYRAELAGRRAMVVLDDAADEAQVRPLLPGEPRCAVVLTSRLRLSGLEVASGLDLQVLAPGTAQDLLAAVAGVDRVAAEPDAAAAIATRCGGLPLALRIAGARLAARPLWSLAHLADRLSDEHHRLDELTAGDLEVRASLALTYRALPERHQQIVRRLALLEVPEFPAWVAAAVVDEPAATGEALAEALVDVHLLESAGEDQAGQTRYRFHDLLRVYARERAFAEDDPTVRARALARAFGGWLNLVEGADRQLPSPTFGTATGTAARWPGPGRPGPPVSVRSTQEALDWFESERPALVAVVEQAAESGMDELAWGLAHTMLGFLATRGHLDDWRRAHEVALAACERAGNRRGRAYMIRGLGQQAIERDELDRALTWLQRAVPVFEEVRDRHGLGYTHIAVGSVHRLAGRPGDALTSLHDALLVLGELGDTRGQAYALQCLGVLHREQGRLGEAESCLERALAGFAGNADRRFEAYTRRSLGLLYRDQRRVDDARNRFTEAMAMLQQLDDKYGAAMLLQDIAELEPDPDRARGLMERALDQAVELGNEFAQAKILRGLGTLHHTRGDLDAAESCLRRSLRLWRQLGMPLYAARSLARLGALQSETGRIAEALASFQEALAVFQELQAPEAAALAERLAGLQQRDVLAHRRRGGHTTKR